MHLQSCDNWYNLLKAVLDPTMFLNWRTTYHDLAENQARINLEYNLNVTCDTGASINPGIIQATVWLHAYFNQVVDLAFKALKACTAQLAQAKSSDKGKNVATFFIKIPQKQSLGHMLKFSTETSWARSAQFKSLSVSSLLYSYWDSPLSPI